MKHSMLVSAVLCALCAAACAADVSQSGSTSSTVSDTSEQTGESAPSSVVVDPQITTKPTEPVFGDGCQIRFWCHNDNAPGDTSAFCIMNICNGTAPIHAKAYCINTCAFGACNMVHNFGACGPG